MALFAAACSDNFFFLLNAFINAAAINPTSAAPAIPLNIHAIFSNPSTFLFNNSNVWDGGARFSEDASFSLNSLVVNCWSLFIIPFMNFDISSDASLIALSISLSFSNIGKPPALLASKRDSWNLAIFSVNFPITVCIFFTSDCVSGFGHAKVCFSSKVYFLFSSEILYKLFASDDSAETFAFDGELYASFPACLGAKSLSASFFCSFGSSFIFLE